VLSRNSLSQIIQDPALDLYRSERASEPLEDVIETMRTRAIFIKTVRTKDEASAISISFVYGDKQKAQAVVRALIAKFAASFERGEKAQNLEIIDPPSLPQFANSPKRPQMVLTSLAGGLVLGLLAALFVKHPRRAMVFASLGVVGCLVGGALSLAIPNKYISTSVIRVVPYDHQFEQALNRIGGSGLRIKIIRLTGTPNAAAVEITYLDADPKKAQAMVSSTIATLIAESRLRQQHVEYVDTPTYPASPVYPNRIVISLMGLCAGLVIATAFLLVQNRRRLRHA
jgi:capsular polysaccharide biosynthesis protein